MQTAAIHSPQTGPVAGAAVGEQDAAQQQGAVVLAIIRGFAARVERIIPAHDLELDITRRTGDGRDRPPGAGGNGQRFLARVDNILVDLGGTRRRPGDRAQRKVHGEDLGWQPGETVLDVAAGIRLLGVGGGDRRLIKVIGLEAHRQ